MSLKLNKLKPARLRFLCAKVKRCNTQVLGRRLDETFTDTHADVIQRIEQQNYKSRGYGWYAPVQSPINVVFWRGRQFVSSLAHPANAENHDTQCKSLQNELAPVAVIAYAFEDRYNYKNRVTCLAHYSQKKCLENVFENLPNDVDTLLELHDASRNIVKPYAYTADDIILDNNLRGINGSKLDVLSGRELDNLFNVSVAESDIVRQAKGGKCAHTSQSQSPYGGSHILDLMELVGFEKHNITALLGDINQYLSLTKASEQDGRNDGDEPQIVNSNHMPRSPQDVLAALSGSVTSGVCNELHVNQGFTYFSSPSETSAPKGISDPKPEDPPNTDQLNVVQDFLAETVPKIFVKQHEYIIYTKDVIFENNYAQKPYTTRGISQYVWQVAKLRTYAHFTFANVRMNIIRLGKDEKEGSVKLHWRLSGIPQLRALAFWKFMPWNYSKNLNQESEWSDGLSTFYVNGTGLIYKHQIDKMIKQVEKEEVNKGSSIAEKLKKLTTEPGLATTPSTGTPPTP